MLPYQINHFQTKKLSLHGFRGVFLRDTLRKKSKLNECGILNLDSSSVDGTVIWFKKGNDKFYFDNYGVQPSSEPMAYLVANILQQRTSPSKTVRCFAVIYVSAH